MTKTLTYHRPDVDLTFSWDGWMQIMIRCGSSVPLWAYPDRFDVREPGMFASDLLPESERPDFGCGDSVHFVPHTQEAFEELCDTWLSGGEMCVGVRDYKAHPWRTTSYGLTHGAFRFRYHGGRYIEAAPFSTQQSHKWSSFPSADNDADAWRPVIDLERDGRTADTLSTVWLMRRTDGWEEELLAHLGISPARQDTDNLHDAIVRWTIATLPRTSQYGSIMGGWGDWIKGRALSGLTGDEWQNWRDLGGVAQRHLDSQPWVTTRTAADGTRWVATWTGAPYAYLYSPDRGARRHVDNRLAHRNERAAGLDLGYLEGRMDEWIAALDRGELEAWKRRIQDVGEAAHRGEVLAS